MSNINSIKPTLQPDVNSSRNVADGNRSTPASSPNVSAPNTETDKVSLSETLASLEAKLANVPEVDSARVDAIKQAIDDGSYTIDSQELARKMIDFEGDF
ncbi:flagellar biosynthesis anti-sigma factor FlgM [Methylophaga sp.]|uniref:flagellar biosynthesis anti-sigma factor FlgM n=1 Tax=Methylophaga sp. TaxID=2024840 RepID=UPI003F697D7E